MKKEIKTIIIPIRPNIDERIELFDKEVNENLAEGFRLIARSYFPDIPYGDGKYIVAILYAELERALV